MTETAWEWSLIPRSHWWSLMTS